MIKNFENYLRKNYEFKYNTVKGRVFYKNKKQKNSRFRLMQERDFNSILVRMMKQGMNIQRNKLLSILYSDFVVNFNPISNYFDELPKWDSRDHITELSNTVKTTKQKTFNWAFKKWLVALVACATSDEIVNQTALILVGKQGVGKSRWIENKLLPIILCDYIFSKNLNPNNKDQILQLAEAILINMEEIGEFNKSQTESFKELITKKIIKERRAYGVFTEEFVRRASFIGSSNNKELLNDVTGNRRFLVFEVLGFDFDKKIDINQVYAQAKELLKGKFRYWFDGQDIIRVNENNSEFVKTSEAEELINENFKVPLKDSKHIEFMNATQVSDYLYLKYKSNGRSRIQGVEVGKVMTALGFKTKKVNGLKKYLVLKK
jgi:predicted P-loop ATPase